MEKLNNFITGLSIGMIIVAGMIMFAAFCEYESKQMDNYESTHNCIYQYNNLCE